MPEENTPSNTDQPGLVTAATSYSASAGAALYEEAMKPWGIRPPRFETLCDYDKNRLERMAQAAIKWAKDQSSPRCASSADALS